MKTVGLVAEYNPFHNGHAYHLREAKRLTGAEAVVVVMSGNFTQRGEPTILDKWTRARLALENGADLVVELPLAMAVQPAHRFADGAVRLLSALQVDAMVFGAEHPDWDFDAMVEAEAAFNKEGFKRFDQTYATLFNEQLKAQTGHSLTGPNDILAFSYAKAKRAQGAKLDLVPIQRVASNYHDQKIRGTIASASAIREAVKKGDDVSQAVPESTAMALAAVDRVPSWDDLYPLLRNQLIQANREQLNAIYQLRDGLGFRMREAAERNLNYDGFLKATKTKRYTYAHLVRAGLYATLNLTTAAVESSVANPVIHVLGFTDRGQAVLHGVKKAVAYPLVTKVDQDLKAGALNVDYRAGKLYQTFTPVEQDLKHAPIRLVSRKNH